VSVLFDFGPCLSVCLSYDLNCSFLSFTLFIYRFSYSVLIDVNFTSGTKNIHFGFYPLTPIFVLALYTLALYRTLSLYTDTES